MSQIQKEFKKHAIIACSAMALFFVSCGDSSTSEDEITKVDPKVMDTTDNINLTLNGKLFSIPSPFQTAQLIKNTGAPYNAGLLNSPDKTSTYSVKFHQALNLGVYGADLGYATMYDQTSEALSYLTSVEKLSKDLDMGGAFSEDIMDRFSENMGNQDSMLVIVSDAYRNGDEYLKNNDRNEEAALILAGGWIEALYFACEVVAINNNQSLIDRIGEQKSTLSSLIELLEQYNTEESYANLVADLKTLYTDFEGVEFTYTFQKPITDKESQTTTIKSSTKVNLTPETLKSIQEKVKNLRTKIIDSAL
jgi:hypothetical protein